MAFYLYVYTIFSHSFGHWQLLPSLLYFTHLMYLRVNQVVSSYLSTLVNLITHSIIIGQMGVGGGLYDSRVKTTSKEASFTSKCWDYYMCLYLSYALFLGGSGPISLKSTFCYLPPNEKLVSCCISEVQSITKIWF